MPVSFGGRNLDIYAADLNRIEVLPGPQGTLFGSSSQSGTVRLITNKPDPTRFEAGIKVGAMTTKGGDVSNSQEAFFNVPLSDRAALRCRRLSRQPGRLDRQHPQRSDQRRLLPQRRSAQPQRYLGGAHQPGKHLRGRRQTATWSRTTSTMPTISAGRISLLYDINDDWSLNVGPSPAVPGDRRRPSPTTPTWTARAASTASLLDSTEDEFGLSTLTINGRAGMLDLIYAVGYLDRDVEAYVDYSDYTNGGGYPDLLPVPRVRRRRQLGEERHGEAPPVMCHDPEAQYSETTSNKRMVHEFRISPPQQEHRGQGHRGRVLRRPENRGCGCLRGCGHP